MTAPPSPAVSNIPCWCSEEEGYDAIVDSDSYSPEMKRVKRLDSAEPVHRDERKSKKDFLKTEFFSGIKESDSRLSFRSLSHHKSCHGIEYDRNSLHSLMNLEFKELKLSNPAQIMRQSSVENIGRVDSRDDPAPLKRRSSLDNMFGDGVGDEAELKSEIKARVVSSYFYHFQEQQQLVGSRQGSPKTGCTKPSHFSEASECTNEKTNGLDTGFEVLDEIKTKFGSSDVTYQSGDDRIVKILLPTSFETLFRSRENVENWSTTNSFQEDDVQPTRLKSVKTPEEHSTEEAPIVVDGEDQQIWHSRVENAFKGELEFSTLVTLAYVRVRDLTNTISKANSYLEAINDGQEEKEKNELRSQILALFKERANLALEHSKWRSEFSKLYQLRKRVLSNLKFQASQAEQSYFTLRKELENLQNEPVFTKPKRSWFSRMCAFIK